MIAIIGDVVEVGPFELGRGCGIEQQPVRVETGAGWNGRQPPQAVDDRHAAIAVDRHEPRPHQRGIVGKAVANRTHRYAKEGRHHRALEGAGDEAFEHGRAQEDVIDHCLEGRLGLVAQQQFQDVDVRAIEAGRLGQAPEPSRRQVLLHTLRGCALVPQRLLETAQLARGHPVVNINDGSLEAGKKPLTGERRGVLAIDPPFNERRRHRVPVMQPRRGIGEVGDDEVTFVGCRHGSLPIRGGERVWRRRTSELVVYTGKFSNPSRSLAASLQRRP